MQHHKRQVTILLTAGHAATTALSTIEHLNEDKHIQWKIVWVGPKKAIEGTNIKPFELDLFPKLGVKVYSIRAGKLQTKFTRHTLPALLKVPLGLLESLAIIIKTKPDIVLSFGGFAALPVVLVATLFRIPVVLHEQTVGAGLANKLSGRLSTKVALARPESEKYFQKDKCVVVGNPLTKEIISTKAQNVLPRNPVIFVTGGSRGAQRVNVELFKALPKLLNRYFVIHQTGELDFGRAMNVKNTLPQTLQSHYTPFSFISPLEIGKIYGQSSIVVGRSGANTVSEIMTIGIPAIFIPIPWTRGNEQVKNAKQAEDAGFAVVLPEDKYNSDTLIQKINQITKNWATMRNKAVPFSVNSIDKNASSTLTKLLTDLVS